MESELTEELDKSKIENNSEKTMETSQMSVSLSAEPSNADDDSNNNLEERYNKLRGFAVKQKKKIADLTERLQVIEVENVRLSSERDEMKNKISHMSDNTRSLQNLQLEYDKLQDESESFKSENKKLIKKLEKLYNEKQENELLNEKITALSEEKTKFENAKERLEERVKDLNNELRAEVVMREQKCKDYEELNKALESEKRAHKATCARLDSLKQECTSNNVLSLEVANYEKSIESIESRLSDEINQKENLESLAKELEITVEVLTKQNAELRESCLSKTSQINILGDKNEALKSSLCESKRETSEASKEISNLLREQRRLESIKVELETKLKLLDSERSKMQNENEIQCEIYRIQIEDLKRDMVASNTALENSKQEIASLKQEFEGYKLRAQSVLRTKKTSHPEIEEELELVQKQNTILSEKCESYKLKIDSLSKDVALLKEDREIGIANHKELNAEILVLRKELTKRIEKQLSLELELESLRIKFNTQIENLQKVHEETIADLTEKHEEAMQKLCLQVTKEASSEPGDEYPGLQHAALGQNSNIILSHPSPPLVEREECEGSESADSCLSTSAVERSRRHSTAVTTSFIPLDQLLESSLDEFDDNVSRSKLEVQTATAEASGRELRVCESRVKHLTALLADAERDIDKLTQMNQLLKEDIRRQQRSVEREEHAVNFEYMKNIIVKFITLENRDERSRLIPVLDTILKLSPEETHKLNAVVAASGSLVGKKGWIPSIPGWNVN